MKGRWIVAVLLAGLTAAHGVVRAQDTPPGAPSGAPPGVPPPEPALAEDEAMVLNFERADIREVIHSLATALGLSYTIDPRIEGQVTIRTTGRIARQDLFPLLNQILRNNGIAMVKVDEVYQILPVGEAKTRAIIPRTSAARELARTDDEFVIEILPVEHVSADEMANILQPFVTPGGDVLSYARANLLVVTDLNSNVDRLRDLVATFDSNVFRDLRTQVYKMKDADPEELAEELLTVLAPYGVAATGADTEGAGVYVIPLPRLSSIVAVAFDPAIFSEIERWLKLLDIPPEEGAGRQTFVYNVENAKAADLAAVLNELFGGEGGGGGLGGARRPGAPPGGVGLFGAGGVAGGRARGGLGGVAAGGAGAGALRGMGRGAGARLGGGSGAEVGDGGGAQLGGGGAQAGAAFGQQAGAAGGAIGRAGGGGLGGAGGRGLGLGRGGRAAGIAGAPGGAGAAVGVSLPGGRPGAAGAQGPPPIFREEVRIVADEVTNSLVILATKRDFQLILDILRRIDVVPRQVVLEVSIAEITLNKDLRFGVAYAISDKTLNKALPGADPNASIFIDRGPPQGTSGAEQLGGLLGTATRTPVQGAFAVISNREGFNMFINALASRTNVKVLSAPHVIAADNREAHILVGQSIPILTSTQTSTIGTSAVFNTVQYRDTGNILTILPQVNSKGLVHMQVRNEVSNVLQESFGTTNSPSFSTREAETTLVVQDGETVIIGGIIGDQVNHTRDGIPYLMDIPMLGRLFRREGDSTQRFELLIVITPYVMRSREEAEAVTAEFTERLQGLKRLGNLIRRRRERIRRQRLGVDTEWQPGVVEVPTPRPGTPAPAAPPPEAAP